MEYITNPVLPGFNPDPSILRVGDDYYIATSTFECEGILVLEGSGLPASPMITGFFT
jgi:beta-xylosidase